LRSSIDSIAAPADAGLPAGTRLCREGTWRQAFYDYSGGGKKQDSKRKAFNRARDQLTKAKLVDPWREYFTLADNSDTPGTGDMPDDPDKTGQV
jgi:hypothetical protein